MKGPCWIKQWIADFAMLNEQFRNEDGTVDFAALGREEYLFRTALITCNFSKSSRAKDVYEIAKRAYDSLSEKGKKGGRPRKDKESTAGAPTREDGEFKSGSGDAVKLESATPAKPSLAYAGKNGLVRLTDDEYALLLQELGNKRKADRLIDDLDYTLAEGKTFKQPHLHVLTHWQSYRDDKAEERKADQEAKAVAKNTMSFQEIEGQRQVEQLRKYGLIK